MISSGLSNLRQLVTYLSSCSASSPCLCFKTEFQWFLIELSGRPKITFAISAQRLVAFFYRMNSAQPSSTLHALFLRRGFSWLFHLSRHYLPVRSGIVFAIISHCLGPISAISSIRTRSCSASHAFFEDFFYILIFELFFSFFIASFMV